MRTSAVITWLHDEIATVLTNTTLVSLTTPESHVDLAQDRDDQRYPFVGIDKRSSDPQSAGLGSGTSFVDSISTDANGVVQSVTRRRDKTLRVAVQTVTDGDEKLRDDLHEDIEDHLAHVARTGSYPDDIREITVHTTTPTGRPDEFVYGDGTPLEIEFSRFTVDDSITAAETVNVDIDAADDAGGTNADTAFDETL